MPSRLSKLLALRWRDRRLLAEAAAWLIVARLAVLALPFRWIAPRLGRTMADSPAEDPAEAELAQRVGWAVAVASRRLPWPSRCLAEAIAGKALLRRRGVASTLYLGLARDGQAALESHAWLRCGRRIVTGGGRAGEGYAVIASFAEHWPQGRSAKASRS